MAQAAASHTYKFNKLTDKNYHPWRLTMEVVLHKLGLFDVVTGRQPCPDRTDPAHAADVRAWEERDLSARLELYVQMDDVQKQSVHTLTTSHQIWLQLEETFQHRSTGSQVNNLKVLMASAMSEDQDVEKFIQKWRLRLDDLLLSGLDLQPRVQAILLLASLPPSWQTFTIAHANTPALSIPTLIPLLLQEAALRHANTSSQASASSPLAMYAGAR